MTRYITPEENQKRALEYRILRSEIKSNHPYRDRGITQDVLARELGVDVKTVRRRENAEFIVTNEALLAIRYVKTPMRRTQVPLADRPKSAPISRQI